MAQFLIFFWVALIKSTYVNQKLRKGRWTNQWRDSSTIIFITKHFATYVFSSDEYPNETRFEFQQPHLGSQLTTSTTTTPSSPRFNSSVFTTTNLVLFTGSANLKFRWTQTAVSTQKQKLSTASDPQSIFHHNIFLYQLLITLTRSELTRHGLTHSLSSTPPRVSEFHTPTSLAKPKLWPPIFTPSSDSPKATSLSFSLQTSFRFRSSTSRSSLLG